MKGIFRGCFEWLQAGCGRGIFSEAASNGTADTFQVLHSVPRPSLMEAGEGSSKRVASDAKSPAGRRFFLVTFFLRAQKKSDSPRGENLPGRAKKLGPHGP